MSYTSNVDDVKNAIAEAEERTLEAIGNFIEGEAIVRAPVDTGNLRNSLTHRVNLSEKSVVIGTPVEYAPYVELGTSKMDAQAYLAPAVNDNLDRLKRLVSEMMKID